MQKIRKKSATWWKHGKHRSVLMEMRKMGEKVKRAAPRMYRSMADLIKAERRK